MNEGMQSPQHYHWSFGQNTYDPIQQLPQKTAGDDGKVENQTINMKNLPREDKASVRNKAKFYIAMRCGLHIEDSLVRLKKSIENQGDPEDAVRDLNDDEVAAREQKKKDKIAKARKKRNNPSDIASVVTGIEE